MAVYRQAPTTNYRPNLPLLAAGLMGRANRFDFPQDSRAWVWASNAFKAGTRTRGSLAYTALSGLGAARLKAWASSTSASPLSIS